MFPDEMCGFSVTSIGFLSLSHQQQPGHPLLTGKSVTSLPLLSAGDL